MKLSGNVIAAVVVAVVATIIIIVASDKSKRSKFTPRFTSQANALAQQSAQFLNMGRKQGPGSTKSLLAFSNAVTTIHTLRSLVPDDQLNKMTGIDMGALDAEAKRLMGLAMGGNRGGTSPPQHQQQQRPPMGSGGPAAVGPPTTPEGGMFEQAGGGGGGSGAGGSFTPDLFNSGSATEAMARGTGRAAGKEDSQPQSNFTDIREQMRAPEAAPRETMGGIANGMNDFARNAAPPASAHSPEGQNRMAQPLGDLGAPQLPREPAMAAAAAAQGPDGQVAPKNAMDGMSESDLFSVGGPLQGPLTGGEQDPIGAGSHEGRTGESNSFTNAF